MTKDKQINYKGDTIVINPKLTPKTPIVRSESGKTYTLLFTEQFPPTVYAISPKDEPKKAILVDTNEVIDTALPKDISSSW